MTTANEFQMQVHFTDDTYGVYETVQKDLASNEAFQKATTMEEAYEAVKEKLSNVTFESFKSFYERFTDYLKGCVDNIFGDLQKERELTDGELDFVSAGGVFSWIKRNWKRVLVCALAVTVGAAVCAVTGGLAVGVIGAAGSLVGLPAATAGFVAGTMATGVATGAGLGYKSFKDKVGWA